MLLDKGVKKVIFTSKCLRFRNQFIKILTRGYVSDLYDSKRFHVPVLAEEVTNIFNPQNGQIFIDMTFGAGGHTSKILDSAKGVKVFALDRDPAAHKLANIMTEKYRNHLIPLLGKFSDLPLLLSEHEVAENSIDGILFDVGCSSMQFNEPNRGFSLLQDGPLDMRMDGERITDQPTAADVLNNLEEEDLAKIFKIYGEERFSKKIARAIFEAKFMFRPLTTTHELADLINNALDKEMRTDKLGRPQHQATKVFQALRIFVNNELNELNYGIELSHKYLKEGGKLVVISFLSLEDKIVKRNMLGIDIDESKNMTLRKYRNVSVYHSEEEIEKIHNKKWTMINKKVIVPTEEEIHLNPRSRSAELRAAFKN